MTAILMTHTELTQTKNTREKKKISSCFLFFFASIFSFEKFRFREEKVKKLLKLTGTDLCNSLQE